MKRLQVPIAALIVVVVGCALALTALKTASDLWYGALYTFTMVLLLAAVIAARFRRGNEKAFWFGFAVFGSAFFVIGLTPWPTALDDEGNVRGDVNLNHKLLTSRVILFLVPYLRTETNDFDAIDRITTNTIGIAHSLTTVATAIVGGLIAVVIRRRRGRLVTVTSLAILAALALATVFASSIASARASAPFFPDLAFGANSAFKTKWFSEHLAAMNEPSLCALAQRDRNATVYRLLWLPSFHHPVCVRIEQTREGAKLRLKVLGGKGGYEPSHVVIDRSIILRTDQVRELDRHLEKAAFWKMPTRVKTRWTVDDGAHLIIEGVERGTYHIVDRMLPGAPYANLCLQMINLSGLDVQHTWGGYHSTTDLQEM